MRLVEQLLALARSEPDAPAAREALDLAALARQAVADLMPLARGRGTELSVDAGQPVAMQGERAALVALIRNLVDNATRAPGGL